MKKAKILISFCAFFIFILLIFVLKPEQKADAYGNIKTHPLLTEKIADLYNAIYDPDLTAEEIQALKTGSTDEDTPPRWINHFYDPTTGSGWQGKRLQGVSEELVMAVAKRVFNKSPVSAENWVNNQEFQNKSYYDYQGNRTFNSAVLYYLDGNNEQAYYSLGYVLHIIEDMTVPAHTRQDTHFDMQGVEEFASALGINDLGLDKGEPYENWAEQNAVISSDEMDNLKKGYQPVCDSLDNCLVYAANYSNNNFYSSDSIEDEDYENPKADHFWQIWVGDKLVRYYYDANNSPLFLAEYNEINKELKGATVADQKIAQSYWDHLAPQAILAGVEVIKYFKDYAEKAKNNEIEVEKPSKISAFTRIRNLSPFGELARFKTFAMGGLAYFNQLVSGENNDTGSENNSDTGNIDIDYDKLYTWVQDEWDNVTEDLDVYFNGGGMEQDWENSWSDENTGDQEELNSDSSIPTPPIVELASANNDSQNPTSESSGSGGSGGGGGSRPVYPTLLITEILIGGVGDEKDEFVELYNSNNTAVDLTGWYLQKKTKTGSNYATFASHNLFEGKTIQPKSYFLISKQNAAYADLGDIITDSSLADDNTLALKNPNGEISDKVGWGQAQDYEITATSNPIEKGKSIARKWDDAGQTYTDTDNNFNDFEEQNPTPKEKNTSPPPTPPVPPVPPTPPPAPTDTLAPTVVFNISAVQNATNFSVSFEITDLSVENVSPSGLAAFQFRWKQGETGEWQGDTEQTITDAPLIYSTTKDFTAPHDETIYYFQAKAKDVADNESDWLPEIPAEAWVRTEKTILINEIQIDSIIGTGGTEDDWVELYNPYDVDVSLAGWSIQKHSKANPCAASSSFSKKNFSNNEKGVFTIPAHGFYLIVSKQASDSLLALADMPISWSLTKDNTIYLVKNENPIESGDDPEIIDKIGFGSVACFPETNSFLIPPGQPSDLGERSIQRKIANLDTNDNSVDFEISDYPTPKTNVADITDYQACGGSSDPGTIYYYLKIRWQALSTDGIYQVQYKKNDNEWRDWQELSQITDTQATFRVPRTFLTDNIYYFRIGLKNTEGNVINWQEIEFDISSPVVINEIAISGTTTSQGNDQWLELYNKTDNDIDLTGWHIISADNVNILLQGTIPAKGYFILERNDDQTIADVSANQVFTPSYLRYSIKLTDQKYREIDNVIVNGWENQGIIDEEGNYYSKERVSPYSFGLDPRNWKINDGQTKNGTDRGGLLVFGTPGQQNSCYQLYTSIFLDFEEDTFLPKSLSPYLFSGRSYTVFPNITLTIEPGVTIGFYNLNGGIFVYGVLNAIGTDSSPEGSITFENANDSVGPGGWTGLYFKQDPEDINAIAGTGELEYVTIKDGGATNSGGFGAGIRADSTSISLKNSIIKGNKNSGIELVNSSAIIDNVQIMNNRRSNIGDRDGAGIIIEGGTPTISNCYFSNNYYGMFISSWRDISGNEIQANPSLINNNNPSLLEDEINGNNIPMWPLIWPPLPLPLP